VKKDGGVAILHIERKLCVCRAAESQKLRRAANRFWVGETRHV